MPMRYYRLLKHVVVYTGNMCHTYSALLDNALENHSLLLPSLYKDPMVYTSYAKIRAVKLASKP